MAVGLAWGSRTTGNPIRQHARLCTVFQKLSRGNKELPGKTRPPWMGDGRLGLGQNRGRNGQKGSQRRIRTTPSIKCGLFCSGQSWADRSGASRDPAARHHAGLREGIRAWGGSWRSLTGDRRNKDGGDKGHDEGSEEPSSSAKPNSNLKVCYTYMNHKRV